MTRHFIIDTGTASDDAVGLILAMLHPGIQIEAITVAAGNVPVDQGVKNALYSVHHWREGTRALGSSCLGTRNPA